MTCSKISSLDFNPGGWINASQNAAASANSNSRYHNGRLKLSNHVDISEEERNDLLKDFFA